MNPWFSIGNELHAAVCDLQNPPSAIVCSGRQKTFTPIDGWSGIQPENCLTILLVESQLGTISELLVRHVWHGFSCKISNRLRAVQFGGFVEERVSPLHRAL